MRHRPTFWNHRGQCCCITQQSSKTVLDPLEWLPCHVLLVVRNHDKRPLVSARVGGRACRCRSNRQAVECTIETQSCPYPGASHLASPCLTVPLPCGPACHPAPTGAEFRRGATARSLCGLPQRITQCESQVTALTIRLGVLSSVRRGARHHQRPPLATGKVSFRFLCGLGGSAPGPSPAWPWASAGQTGGYREGCEPLKPLTKNLGA